MADAPSQLQREIRQSRPFRSHSEEALLGLMRTADRLRRRIARVVEAAGVSHQQYNILRILRGAGDLGLPTLEVAARTIEETPAITRLIDKLEAKELVTRRHCPEDRRRVWCKITPAGVDLLARLDPQVAAAGEAAMAPLDENEARVLVGFLDRLRSG